MTRLDRDAAREALGAIPRPADLAQAHRRRRDADRPALPARGLPLRLALDDVCLTRGLDAEGLAAPAATVPPLGRAGHLGVHGFCGGQREHGQSEQRGQEPASGTQSLSRVRDPGIIGSLPTKICETTPHELSRLPKHG